MTQTKPAQKTFTKEQRERAIRAFRSRGDKTVNDVAEANKVSVATLYHWVKKDDERVAAEVAAKVAPKAPLVTREQIEPGGYKLGSAELQVLRNENRDLKRQVRRLQRVITVALEMDPQT